MKKAISFLMAAVMLLSLSTTALADDSYLSGDGDSATSTVEYYVDPSYIVVIPETIDGRGELCLTALSVKILDTQQVNVNCDELYNSNITLTNDNGDSIDFTFKNLHGNTCVAAFLNGDTTSQFSVWGEAVNAEMANPGTYSGTVTFRVSLSLVGNY